MSKKYYDALDALLDKPIAYNPAFKKITGRTSAAVWLSQVWYWSKRATLPDGWFWKSAKECEEETGLTDNEQKTAREICVKLGVVEEKLKGVPATMHYRIIKPKIYELLGVQFPTQQESGSAGNSQIPTKQESDGVDNFNKESESTPQNTPPARGLTKKELAQANAKVDAMIENAKKFKYPHRDKIPEPYLEYCDTYVELTGQEPRKSVLMEWLSEFSEWMSAGLSVANIRAAYEHSQRPDGGFLVGRPKSLTNTAVALKSKKVAPAIDEKAVEETRRMLDEKEDKFVPRPEGLRPQIGKLVNQFSKRTGQ